MKMWKTLWVAGTFLIFGGQALADPITLDPAVDTAETTSESAECLADVNCAGLSGTKKIVDWLISQGYDLTSELYKSDVGEDDSGPYAGDYDTVYDNTPEDPMDATISSVNGRNISDPHWLLVKDGNATPIWYLYDISGWDGSSDITLTNFWPTNGAISHVSIYGGVPEPGTLALFGIALAGFGLARRRKATVQA